MNRQIFSAEEIRLFEMIAESLSFCAAPPETAPEAAELDYHALIELAGHHAVLPILYPICGKLALHQEDRAFLEMMIRRTAGEFYQLLFNMRELLQVLDSGKIPVVVLKGLSVARFYPVAEYRKSSDIDLLLADPADEARVARLLTEAGYRMLPQEGSVDVRHHTEWATRDNHVMELHTMLVEPFDDERLNRFIKARYVLKAQERIEAEALGIRFPVLVDGLQAFHLLLHMLQDFRRSGFGLKLLCDWVVFWNRRVEPEQVRIYLAAVEEARVSKFSAAITWLCVRYLGLRVDGEGTLMQKTDGLYYENGRFCDLTDDTLTDALLSDVLEAERYGKPETERMVTLRGRGFFAYFREFHHQTVLSFPRASRAIVALPVLYLAVFLRFLRHNRTARNGQSFSGILKNVSKRSRLAEKLL